MERMVVAYVCDDTYIPYLKVSMESIQRYNKNVEFAILSTKKFNVPGAKVYTINPDTSKFKFREEDRMGDGVYYKFWLPELPYDKILYIDCDVLCQRPLNSLWKIPCDFICATESHSTGKVQASLLRIKKYALSGVMLMNLKALREVNFTEQCLNALSTMNPMFHDETIINVLFSKKITFIDKKYNYCKNRTYSKPIAESDAYLLHYVGEQKKDLLKIDNFSKLNKLKRELSGKTIAIVGNSTGILTSGQAKEIDAHDIVIRFNKGYPNEKVGLKTDIVFFACTLPEKDLRAYGDARRVKRSMYCTHRCDFLLSESDRYQFDQKVTIGARLTNVKAKTSQASTGFIAINFVLSCDYKSIDLYGFDFFNSNTYYNPRGYQTSHNGSDEGEKIREYEKCGLLKIN